MALVCGAGCVTLLWQDRWYQLGDVYSDEWGPGVIYDVFSTVPAEFESFCGQLLMDMGMQVKITQATRDGGYDLIAYDGSEVIAVECKCYFPDRKVTRPMLQKLTGANTVLGADGLMFLTTGMFTKDAVLYGSDVGIRLIDGNRLAQLVRQYMRLD